MGLKQEVRAVEVEQANEHDQQDAQDSADPPAQDQLLGEEEVAPGGVAGSGSTTAR